MPRRRRDRSRVAPEGLRRPEVRAHDRGEPSLRARARLALDRTEAAVAETIAEEVGASNRDHTPRALAAMVCSIERLLMEDARAAILRADAAAAKRKLRRTCDRAFELLEPGVRGYGRRGKR
jgi:hypothetical protein